MNPRVDDPAEAAWKEFLHSVEGKLAAIGCNDRMKAEPWFRGHTRGDYALLPSLFRYFENPNDEDTWEKAWNMESDFFWEFAARGRELHGVIEEDWDVLFAMQH